MQTKKLRYLLLFAVIAIAATVVCLLGQNAAVFAGSYWHCGTKARFCGF